MEVQWFFRFHELPDDLQENHLDNKSSAVTSAGGRNIESEDFFLTDQVDANIDANSLLSRIHLQQHTGTDGNGSATTNIALSIPIQCTSFAKIKRSPVIKDIDSLHTIERGDLLGFWKYSSLVKEGLPSCTTKKATRTTATRPCTSGPPTRTPPTPT